jgi:hypothetical protein
MLVLGKGFGEVSEEVVHDRDGNRRQDEVEGLAGGRFGGGEDVGPVKLLVAEAGRALALEPPPMTQAPLLANAGFVLEEQAAALIRMGRGGCRQGVAKPLFWKRSCASGCRFG